MFSHFTSAVAPFDVLVLLAPSGGPGVLEAVLADLPADLPAAVLIGPSPGRELPLVETLGRHTPLPVHVAEDSTVLQPGHLYVSPPHTVLEVRPDGRCAVTPGGEWTSERPLDRLLASLAVSCGERALAVVLGGQGRDGLSGARALRGAGGTVLVGDPAPADPADLARAVVEAGAADRVVSPWDLGHTITTLLAGRHVLPPGEVALVEKTAERCDEGIIGRMGDAHCVLDREFRIQSVNAAAERLLGVPHTALLGHSHWDAFRALVDAPVGLALRRVVAEGTEQHLTHHSTGEGHDLHLEVNAYPAEGGGVSLFWRDVTGRVQAEAALRESEEKYRALFEQMDEAYAVVEVLADAEGRWTDFRFLDANPAFLRHTGMPYPVGRTATELLGTPNPRWAELYGRAVDTGASIRVEETELTLGRVFDLNIFRLGGEGSQRVAVLFTDITGRKQAEEALRASEERQAFLLKLSDALRAAPDADAVGHRALGLLSKHLRLDRCYIGVYRLEDDWGAFTHQVGNDHVPPVPSGVRLSDFPDALRVAFDRTLVIGDVAHTGGLSNVDRQNLSGLDMGALVAATLRKGEGHPLWSIVAISATARRWTPGEIALLEEVTERTWSAMERARAQAALRASEARYRTIFDSVDEGFVLAELLYDGEGRPVDALYLEGNPAASLLTGVPDFSRRRLSEVMPGAEPSWLEVYDRVARTGVAERLERHLGPLGRWYDFQVSRVADGALESAQRGPHRVAVIFQDVTERKRREANQGLLVEISNDLSQPSSEEELLHTVGAKLAAHLGLTCYHYVDVDEDRGEVTVRHFWHALDVPAVLGTYPIDGFIPPDGLNRLRAGETSVVRDAQHGLPGDTAATAGLRAGAAAQQIGAYVAVPYSQDGRWKAYFAVADSRARPWTTPEISLIQEVAGRVFPRIERARTEDARRTSEARFRAVANLVPDLLWESRPDGFTTWYNQRWLDYTGQTLEQATGWGWTNAVHPEDREGSAQRYGQAVQAGQPLRQEHRIRRHDGEYHWFVVNTVPIRDERGEVVWVYGAATDIHHLRVKSALLEERVEDRTRRLADLNSELRALAAASFHELSEPLRRLRGLLHLLERRAGDGLDEQMERYIELIRAEAQRAEGLAENLTALARLQNQELKPSRVALTPLLVQVRSDLAPALGARAGKWTVGELPVVEGDALLLRQAFTELVYHALRSAPGEARVEVGAEGSGDRVGVTVTVTPTQAEGADPGGDGLATARRVVRRHGGTLDVDVRGDQARFVVRLPGRLGE
ncbi:PAS domain S-box protein [Deinococcus aestuarii]|uniref:PAS domain S-box protein n=1 Tax=Deinococcus aestuarii TaxID=2774531 RepID=UPI001C0CD107|nr:PAS domain S-box protein [Deinococcus aestuarii]